MGFPRSHLNESEEVVLEMHPHWWFMVPRGLLLFASLILGLWAWQLDGDGGGTQAIKWVAVAVLVFFLLAFVQQLVKWLSTDFVVTTERCIYRSGIIAKNGVEIPLDRINTVFFNQGIFERMIRAGDIGIESAGENSRQEFSDIYNPVFVQSTIYRQMEAYENRRQDRLGHVVRHGHAPEDPPPSTPATPSSPAAAGLTVAEQIEKLHQLRDRGALTDEEYAAEKARLLNQG